MTLALFREHYFLTRRRSPVEHLLFPDVCPLDVPLARSLGHRLSGSVTFYWVYYSFLVGTMEYLDVFSTFFFFFLYEIAYPIILVFLF